MTPVFRLEYFIVAAANGTPCDLEPIFNEEKYLHAIAGASVDLPMPIGRTQEYLAKLAGMDVEIPDHPIFRTEYYLAHMIDSTVECPAPIFREEMFYYEWASNEYVTVTGNPVSFTAKAAPLKQLSVAFSPVQSGTGNPSPDNVRPISGWDSLNVYHSGADTSNPQTISISLGETVYSGTVDVISGVLTVTHILNTYDGDEDWNISTSGTKHYFYVPTTENIRVLQTPISNLFKGQENRQYTDLADGEFAMTRAPAMGYFNIRYDAISTKADFTSMLSQTPMTIVCKLATPVTIQLTPQEVSSLLGENNMWSNANGDLTVTYAADPATMPIVGTGKVGQAIIGG